MSILTCIWNNCRCVVCAGVLQLSDDDDELTELFVKPGDDPSCQPRPTVVTKSNPYKPYITERVQPALPIYLSAVVIPREIKGQGYDGGKRGGARV